MDQKVVVLVDEYDKPLIDQINNIELAQEIRDILRGFYGILKAQDGNLKFIFLTGVTKFSKVSVFSGLNNLIDLSMLDKYSGLLGYTHDELLHYFTDSVKSLASELGISEKQCFFNIKQWYNGYRFTEDGGLVYNPFSVLNLFKTEKFKNYWFESGTPTFLIKLIKDREFNVMNVEELEVSSATFSTFEIDRIPTLPLLYQTGYLTIKGHDPELNTYRLGYPNREVSESFSESFVDVFFPKRTLIALISSPSFVII